MNARCAGLCTSKTSLLAAIALCCAACNGGGGPDIPPRDAADSAPSAWAQPGGDPRNSRVSAYTGPASIASRGSYSAGGVVQEHSAVVFSMDSAAYFSTGTLHAVDARLSPLWSYVGEGRHTAGDVALGAGGNVITSEHDDDAHPESIPSDSAFLLRLSPEGELLQETEIGRSRKLLFGTDGTVYSRVTDAHGESHDLLAWSASNELLWRAELENGVRTLPEMALASLNGQAWIFAGRETRVRADGGLKETIGESAWSGLALDPQGNAYLESDGLVAFMKIDPSKQILWQYPAEVTTDPGYSPAAVSADGHVALQVYHEDRRAVLLDSSGALIWDYELSSADLPSFSAPDVLMDSAGNCFFTFGSELLAIDAAGAELWTEDVSPEVLVGQPAIAPNGNLYVLARSGKLLVFSEDVAAFGT